MPPKNSNKKKQQPEGKKLGSFTDDPRFRKVHNDPRFLKPKKKDTKVTIDNRFASMLKSKEFSNSPHVDKYGRRLEQDTAENELRRFYHIDEDEESDEEEEKSLEELERELAADEGNREDVVEAKYNAGYDPMRGVGIDSSDESSDEESEEEVEEEEEIPTGEETHRLALMNMDWDHVKSVDILKILSGFKPVAAVIKSVSIYPSKFGKERMQREDMDGPPTEIFRDSAKNTAESKATSSKAIEEEEGTGEDFDQEKLRKYQKDRLKYYYAVIDCDSLETAKVIYENCDGTEFESSANILDLRYIPNDTTFDDEPTDMATIVPDNYKPINFSTEALQRTRVKLTWDQDDPNRANVTRRDFTEEDLNNLDFDAYLASSDDDEDEDDVEVIREKYRKMLAGLDGSTVFEDQRNDDEEGDMEITFTPGLSETAASAVSSKLNKQEEQEETTIEKYMRKQREKRKAKKERRTATNEDSSDEDEDEDEETKNDPFFREAAQEMESEGFGSSDKASKKEKKSKKRQSKEERLEKQRQKAELELLMDDKDKTGDGFNMKEVMKREKQEKRKGKKGRQAEQTEDDFEIDVEDPRFAALHDSHHFAVDPTNPQFKKTKNMKKLLDTRQLKMKETRVEADEWKKNAKPKPKQPSEKPKKDTALSQLVAAVKRKGALNDNQLGKRQKKAKN